MREYSPWDDWVPGVLSYRQVKELIDEGYIECQDDFPSLDHSSIDLTLANEIYELTSGSVKPFGERYLHQIKRMGLATKIDSNDDGIYELTKKKTYLIKLNENIVSLKKSHVYGQATAKSSIGRMDVLARLIVDGMKTYEEFDPKDIGDGKMYLEVTPITFNVKVKAGISLTQLRFFKGLPKECEINSHTFFQTVIRNDRKNTDGSLSLDTSSVVVKYSRKERKVAAFRSVADSEVKYEPINLWGSKHTSPAAHWELVSHDKFKRIRIEPGRFYIMRSYERIAVPKGVAVYCRAIDETIGEMRIHYAGFAHPFFGYNKHEEPVGTPLVFEVRGHDVDVSLGSREKMAKLVFYRMSEDASPKDKEIDDSDPYQHQELQLSKFFKDWD